MGKNEEDTAIVAEVAARIAEAKATLAARMRAMDLTREKGWRVAEGLRDTPTGHEFVFRPIHIHLHDESGLEVTVPIGPDGRPV
jgi:hypothetical protein